MSLVSRRAARRPLPRALRRLGSVLLATLALLPIAAAPAAAERRDPVTGEWPLRPPPRVVEGFDPPRSPWGAGHRGVDLAAAVGVPVRAARAGSVSFAGVIAGRGVVVVDHGATRTTYEPVDASVSVGDHVAAGEVIGTLALFGSHCFPRACLHWGLLDGESYLDPLTLVGAAPVRLLPFLADLPPAPVETRAVPVPQLPDWRPLGSAQLFRS